MATPDFIRTIRATAGHQLLLLPGVTAIVFDDEGRVLLGRRADTGKWSVIGGIPDPGEQPADGGARGATRRPAVRCVAERVVLVQALAARAVRQRRPLPVHGHHLPLPGRPAARPGSTTTSRWRWAGSRWTRCRRSTEFALFRIKQALTEGPAWFQPTPVDA